MARGQGCSSLSHVTRHKSTKSLIIIVLLLFSVFLVVINYRVYDSHNAAVTSPRIVTSSPVVRSPPVITSQPVVTSLTGIRTSLLEASADNVVPSIVHYVWFGESTTLRFHQMLSILSASKFIRPDKILFHCDDVPIGPWWKFIKKNVTNLEIIKRKPPEEIFGNEVILPEHKSDIARMEVVRKYGGIYLDTDVIALRSFEPLRKYNYTMGIEYHGNPGRLNNGVIIAAKNASFLQVWLETYRNFTKREWDYHDSVIPYWLQFTHPHLIHVEENTINYPSGKRLDLIYDKVYDWHNNYAIHLWYRLHEIDHNPRDIRQMNSTFGEIARYVYYGHSKLLSN